MGPKPTWLLARTTPPPSTGWPVRSTLMVPTAPPLSVASIRRVTCPFALGFDWVSDPVNEALNGAVGTDAVVVGAGVLVDAGVLAPAHGEAPPDREDHCHDAHHGEDEHEADLRVAARRETVDHDEGPA